MDIEKQIESGKDIVINSFEDLAQLVQPFRKSGKWIFRGVCDSTYQLIPSIGRKDKRKDRSGNNLPYDVEAEKKMIRHFIRSAGPYVKHIPKSQLEWLAFAQHHGMFTRLLDWSESLLVAAYFAVEDMRGKDSKPAIYCVRNVKIAPSDASDLDDLDDVVVYYPPHISPRIPAQSSIFTVHKNPSEAFSPKDMIRIVIDNQPLTLKFNLNACGINKASLFPGVDGLAEYQSWLYKWGEHREFAD